MLAVDFYKKITKDFKIFSDKFKYEDNPHISFNN